MVSSYSTGPWRFRGNLCKSLESSFLWNPLPTNYLQWLPWTFTSVSIQGDCQLCLGTPFHTRCCSLGTLFSCKSGNRRGLNLSFSLLSSNTTLCYPLSNIWKQFLRFWTVIYLLKGRAYIKQLLVIPSWPEAYILLHRVNSELIFFLLLKYLMACFRNQLVLLFSLLCYSWFLFTLLFH